MFKKFETTFAGKKLVVETGKMANLSNGSCLVIYGETDVLVNVNMSKEPKEGIDFLPLSVDYDERLYAVGKIPGGYIKREGKPSTKAVLVSRVIDRPLRPLFPKDYRNDTAINALVLAVDPDILPEIPASVGASIALNISDIPFDVLVGTVKVGIVDGEIADQAKLANYATLPSRDTLLTMLAGGMIGVVRDLSICLDLYSQQKEEN